MAVINILKDGTIVDDMSTVTVPNKIVENIARIYLRMEEENERKRNNNTGLHRDEPVQRVVSCAE